MTIQNSLTKEISWDSRIKPLYDTKPSASNDMLIVFIIMPFPKYRIIGITEYAAF